MKRFIRTVLGAICVSVTSAVLFVGCSDDDDHATAATSASVGRLAAALIARDLAAAKVDEFQAARAAVDLVKRARDAAASAPTNSTAQAAAGGEVSPHGWLSPGEPAVNSVVAQRDALLRELVEKRERTALRGAVDSYLQQAIVDWETTFLQHVVQIHGGPKDYPPSNVHRLLTTAQRAEIRQAWEHRQRFFREMAAERPQEYFTAALRECEARLAGLDEADRLPSPVMPRLRKARDALGAQAEIERRLAGRDQEINASERGLLRQALASNPDDVAAEYRLATLERTAGTGRAAARRLVDDLAPKPLRPNPGEDFVESLMTDPVRAAETEASLRVEWNAYRSSPHRSVALSDDFERWVAAHLPDGELSRIDLFGHEIDARVRLAVARSLDPQNTSRAAARVSGFATAARRELAERRLGAIRRVTGETGGPTLGTVVKAGSDSRAVMAAEFGILREMQASGVRHDAVERRIASVSLTGWKDQIEALVRDGEDLRKLRGTLTQSVLETRPVDVERSLDVMSRTFLDRAGRIRTGLDGLPASMVRETGALKATLDDLVFKTTPASRFATWSPPATGPPMPFGDGSLMLAARDFRASLAAAQAATPVAAATGGAPSVLMDSSLDSRIETGTKGKRPTQEPWKLDGERVTYEDIDGLKKLRAVPGGVALGRTAELAGDWSAYILVYSKADGRLQLVGRNRAVEVTRVQPDVLKACAGYVKGGGAVAVSIGLSPTRTARGGPNAEAVFVDAALRDTQVGLDLISADRLPWSLSETRLPNGKESPPAVVATLRPQLLAWNAAVERSEPTTAVLERLGDVVPQIQQASPATLLKTLDDATGSERIIDLVLHATLQADSAGERYEHYLAIETRALGFESALGSKRAREHASLKAYFNALPAAEPQAAFSVVYASLQGEQSMTWDEVKQLTLALAALTTPPRDATKMARDVMTLLRSRELSLLTDARVTASPSADQLRPDAQLRIRYVHGVIEAASSGLAVRDQGTELQKAGADATAAIPQLEKVYEPLRLAREHAALMGFLRWAFTPGHLADVDLADLSSVNAHQARTRTPDYMCRGSQPQMRACAAQFGVLR
jgi:hypothetical protein